MHFQVVLTSGSPVLCERISSSSNLLPELAKGIAVSAADLNEPQAIVANQRAFHIAREASLDGLDHELR